MAVFVPLPLEQRKVVARRCRLRAEAELGERAMKCGIVDEIVAERPAIAGTWPSSQGIELAPDRLTQGRRSFRAMWRPPLCQGRVA
jgi:hypothetical protein